MNGYKQTPRPLKRLPASSLLPTLTQTFHDIEQFEEKIEFSGVKLTQLTPGRFNGSVSAVQSQSVLVLHSFTSPKLYIQGCKSVYLINFFLIMNPGSHVISHGSLLDKNYIFGFDSGRDLNSVLSENSDIGHIFIPHKKFADYTNQMQRDDLNSKFLKSNYIRPNPEKMIQFRDYFQQILYLLKSDSEFLGQLQTQTFLEEDLIPLLIDTLDPSEKPYKPLRRYQRAQMVKKVHEYMLDHIDSPLTLKNLCDAVESSSRALIYGFQDLFGMTPMSYLKVQRLNGVHRALKKANPDDTVMRIASYWGFWSMGHFSRDYKQMFGESPSETLKREYSKNNSRPRKN